MKQQKSLHKVLAENIGFVFVLPWLIGFLLFKVYPFASSLYYSFTNYDMFSGISKYGMMNYNKIFTDEDILRAFKVTFKYAIFDVPLKLAFALFIAYILNFKLKGVNFFRTAYYIPSILGGLVGAAVFGCVAGIIFGIRPIDMVIKYVLPIMGGGNGAGAVPLSQIYEQISGEPAANYYSFAIIVLTIANLFCIVAGALLNRLGQVKPELTGDGTNIMPVDSNLIKEDVKVKVTLNDYTGVLLLCGTIYAVGRLFSKVLLPSVFGAQIHTFAYSIIFVVIIAALGIVPANIRVAAKHMQGFMVSVVGLMCMVSMGVDFDLAELASACSPANLLIAFVIVLGAILGSALVGKLVGFYPIDAAVTAGLCMANRGGSGDIAVLGAAHRLDLISYAQLSSRVGGGIVLIIASFFFSFFL